MKTLTVNLEDRSYPIYIGTNIGLNEELYCKHISSKTVALITNEQIADLYLKEISHTLSSFDLKTQLPAPVTATLTSFFNFAT